MKGWVMQERMLREVNPSHANWERINYRLVHAFNNTYDVVISDGVVDDVVNLYE